MRLGLGPDHEHVGNGGVRDPHFGPVQHIAAVCLCRARLHTRRVRACIGLGQAETANPFAGRQFGQVFLLLRLGPIGLDRIHHQRRLHRHHRAVTAVDPLHLARDEAVGDVSRADPAVGVGHGDAKQPGGPHLGEDRRVGRLIEIGVLHAGCELVGGKGGRRVADHSLVFFELIVQQERVFPLETLSFRVGHLILLLRRFHVHNR